MNVVTVSCALLFAVGVGLANPLRDPSKCGYPHCAAGSKFRYQSGTRYEYSYRASVTTLFVGPKSNRSSFDVEATFALDFYTPCDALLTIAEARLVANSADRADGQLEDDEEEAEADPFAEDVKRHPLRLSFDDGDIRAVCPEDEDPSWAVNFKRGILSMLQNTMERFDIDHEGPETDVRGTCITKYNLQGAEGTSLIINKSKDMTNCKDRHKIQSAVQTTTYNSRSGTGTFEILKSNVSCVLSIDHNVYNAVTCEEKHVFQPFSNESSGATTLSFQKLELISEDPYSIGEPETINRRESILFDHNFTPKPTSDELRTARDLIKKLCKLTMDDPDVGFSDLFSSFVHTSRLLSPVGMATLYARAHTICKDGKKHVLDALPYIGSVGSVQLMVDLIRSGNIDHYDEWIMSFALLPRPSTGMLPSMVKLLQGAPEQASSSLVAASLVRTYCRNSANCEANQHVQEIVEVFEERVREAHSTMNDDRPTMEKMIVSLKSLGNMGLVSESFEEIVEELIGNEDLPIAARIAAIQMYRRRPCEDKRDFFLAIYKEPSGDPEIRIAAYLQLMRCPDFASIAVIRRILESEEVNQVGSFVWSHLNSILKSSNPMRIEIQCILSDRILKKRFSTDIRKFSRNFEKSFYYDEYNLGGSFESNVIYSPSSYVPRTAMFNISVDLFGESVNLIELDSRIEGFEHILESYFGSKGPFSMDTVGQYFNKIRTARSAKSDEKLKTDIARIPNILDLPSNDPKISLGMRVFGNELRYLTFHGKEEIKAALKHVNPMEYLKRLLSGKEISYNNAAMFMDASFVVPSGTGFPLTLNALGTAAVNLKIHGFLNMSEFTEKKKLSMIGRFYPSLELDVTGSMTVDAYHTGTGIKVKSSIYTSTAVEGHVKIEGTKFASVKFNLPREKMEIFGAQSDIIVMQGDKGVKQAGPKEQEVSNKLCLWSAVNKTIGLQLCAEYCFQNVTRPENLQFLLSGPSKFRVSAQKTDPTKNTFLLEYRWESFANNQSVYSFIFDMPGSRIKRIISANVTADLHTKNLTVFLESAIGTFLARGNYKNAAAEKLLNLSLDINEKKHFDSSARLKIRNHHNGLIYYPTFFVRINNESIADLNGTVNYLHKKDISQWNIDMNFQTKKQKSKLVGYVMKSNSSITSRLELGYRFTNSTPEKVTLGFKVSDQSSMLLHSLHGELRLESTAYSHFDFNSTLKFQRNNGHYDLKLEIHNSPHPKNDSNTLTTRLVVTYQGKKGFKLNTYLSFQRPSTKLNALFQVNHEIVGSDVNSQWLFMLAENKKLQLSVFLHHPDAQKSLFIETKLNMTIPGFTPMTAHAKLSENSRRHHTSTLGYEIKVNATWFSGHSVTVEGVYQDRSSHYATDHHVKLHIKSPSFQDSVYLTGEFFKDTTDTKLDAQIDYSKKKYALLLKHRQRDAFGFEIFGELQLNTKTYTLLCDVLLKDKREITLEIHLDKVRDIRVHLKSIYNSAVKNLLVEVKLDANRDPSQKLLLTVELLTPKAYNYTGNLLVYYPDRTINGHFDFDLHSNGLTSSGLLSWDPIQKISYKVITSYRFEADQYLKLILESRSPYEGWTQTSINGEFYHRDSMYHLNGSVHWLESEYVAVDLYSDHNITETTVDVQLSAVLDSSIAEIRSLSGSLSHHHSASKVNSSVDIKYYPSKVLSFTNTWTITRNGQMKHLVGLVSLVSPFKGYNNGQLVSEFYVTKTRQIKGFAELDLDHRKYTTRIDGDLLRLSNCKLNFNVTTPLEKYKTLTGRFGFSEERRHFVAKITSAPKFVSGIEILLSINNISDFDILFDLGTPLTFMQHILAVGKLQRDRVDFRLKFNDLMAGFAGVWYYYNLTSFEYSYQLFTPIDNFEETSVIAKLLYDTDLDMAFRLKLEKTKLGITVEKRQKPEGNNEFIALPGSSEWEDVYVDEENEVKKISGWDGFLQLDVIILPTINANVDYTLADKSSMTVVNLKLPDGDVYLRNDLVQGEYFSGSNKLYISSSYEQYKELSLNTDLNVERGKKVSLNIEFYRLNSTIRQEALLSIMTGQILHDDAKEIECNLLLKTPFDALPLINFNALMKLEEHAYRADLLLKTNSTKIVLQGNLEADKGFVDSTMKLSIASPQLTIKALEASFKKDFSSTGHTLDSAVVFQRNSSERHEIVLFWYMQSKTQFEALMRLNSANGKHSDLYKLNVACGDGQDGQTARLNVVLNQHLELKASASMRNNSVQCEMFGKIDGKTHEAVVNGVVEKKSEKLREFRGSVQCDSNAYSLIASLSPENGQFDFTPIAGGNSTVVRYDVQPQQHGYAVRVNSRTGEHTISMESHISMKDNMDSDFMLMLHTPFDNMESFVVKSQLKGNADNEILYTFSSETPIKGLEAAKISGNFRHDQFIGAAGAIYTFPSCSANFSVNWKLILLQDILFEFSGNIDREDFKKKAFLDVFFSQTKGKIGMNNFGGDLIVDDGKWAMGANMTWSQPTSSILPLRAKVEIKVPPPHLDVHVVSLTSDWENSAVQFDAGYATKNTNLNYGSKGYVITNQGNVAGDVTTYWGIGPKNQIDSFLSYNTTPTTKDLLCKLKTPKDTFIGDFKFKKQLEYYNISANLRRPESNKIAKIVVNFKDFSNMDGTLNITTPFKDITYIGADFYANKNLWNSVKRFEVFWPNNTAVLNSNYEQKYADLGSSGKGVISCELPIQKRHKIGLNYGFTQKALLTTGYASVECDKTVLMDGRYKCVSQSTGGFEQDDVNIELKNPFKNLGVHYVHQEGYDAKGNTDLKTINLFDLFNKTALNVSGEVRVRSRETGQDMIISATHSTKTVTLESVYDSLGNRMVQTSKLKLAKDVWIAYDFDLLTHSRESTRESQEVTLNISYPSRNFTAHGFYDVNETSLASEASLIWDREIQMKTVHASLGWNKNENLPNHHEVELQLKHPTFEKNVSFKGTFEADSTKIAAVEVVVDYAQDPDRTLRLAGSLNDHSRDNVRNYSYMITGTHPTTSLDLNMRGEFIARPKWYKAYSEAQYKRTYLPTQSGEMYGKLDMLGYEIETKKTSPRERTYLRAKYNGSFPTYNLNTSIVYGKDLDSEGIFFVDLDEKLIQAEMNLTEDASKSFHVYGFIPNARYSSFNVWRNYDDTRVDDISFFLRLNHSRLVVSKLNWRPQLHQEIKESVYKFFNEMQTEYIESLDYWQQYIKSEGSEAVNDIWNDAEVLVSGFLSDTRDLQVLVNDVEELKSFLNQSYYANDFYIRDFSNFLLQMLNETSIRTQIETLPEIFNEIWKVMGASSQVIQKTVKWFIETIKSMYKKTTEFFVSLMKGEFLQEVSKLADKVAARWSDYVKELHVSFIENIERLWNNSYEALVQHWHSMLETFEPAFIKFAHYAEAIAWSTMREFLEYLYEKKVELEESPIFVHLANFTRDFDRIYKDWTNKDIITNLNTYVPMVWKFVRDRYFAMVPFGKELQDIFMELVNEIKELRHLPSIKYILDKYNEMYARVQWLYTRFEVGNRIGKFLTFARMKSPDLVLTALDAENKYRKEKTKFIFDLHTGTMHLEQKLPMSWHAFNETPKFQEIREFQLLLSFKNYISFNFTIWPMYNDLIQMMSVKEWSPPFSAHAMLIGPEHFITFDKTYYSFRGSCTYLLASDFLDRNFSIAISYGKTDKNAYTIYFLIRNNTVQIDMQEKVVKINSQSSLHLPIELDGVFVFQALDEVVIESEANFAFQCNLKYQVCYMRVSGWYFGKTAGLWGTINNEPADDMLTSVKTIASYPTSLAQSWALDPQKCRAHNNLASKISEDDDVHEMCQSLFDNPMSPFSSCHRTVDPAPFLTMCLTSPNVDGVCSIAVAYVETCGLKNSNVRIPDICVHCSLANESVPEGHFQRYEWNNVTRSTDVVFILEAKECNRHIKTKRNIDAIVAAMNTELLRIGLVDIRYAVVVYGGPGVYENPRSIVLNGNIFANHTTIPQYFNNIQTGNGSSYTFGAVVFASRLLFRPGVKKTFILLPCSDCDAFSLKFQFDYPVLHQLLYMHGISLHILMNAEFEVEKARLRKSFFGVDMTRAYTQADSKGLSGNAELRKQVKLPKSSLGLCTSLALETNGTIFAATKLEDEKKSFVKKFVDVFTKRVAQGSVPPACQMCECTAYNSGVSYMECYPCHIPTVVYNDYVYDEDEMLRHMQPMKDDYDEYESSRETASGLNF